MLQPISLVMAAPILLAFDLCRYGTAYFAEAFVPDTAPFWIGKGGRAHVCSPSYRLQGDEVNCLVPITKNLMLFGESHRCTSSGHRNEDNTQSVSITESDCKFMSMALRYARLGFGFTYPNPAVGCVLVRMKRSKIICNSYGNAGIILGSGFHPKSGMPHAEVFALLEASGAVKDGIAAARSVMSARTKEYEKGTIENEKIHARVGELLHEYSSEGGAKRLFAGCCASEADELVTAYVTLEPCSHYGKTPPCARSLVYAGVDRVVVGFRDPNPKVDGGGVRLLMDSGIHVDIMTKDNSNGLSMECAEIVECFVKRMTRPNIDHVDISGKQRAAIRRLAGRMKNAGEIPEMILFEISTSGERLVAYGSENVDELFKSVCGWWLEEADRNLWSNEVLLLRLGAVVAKRKAANTLGHLIAQELGAHVAQVVGHTVLLYRPGVPPVLDLDDM